MKNTIPATDIGSKDSGYAIVTLLSANAQDKISNLQNELSEALPGLLWMMPLSSLHSTLCEFIQPKHYEEDKSKIYENIHEEYESAVKEVLSKHGTIKVTFNKIEASPNAIVIMGNDGGAFNQIRAELLQKISLPAETKLPPNVVHSSIARYKKEIELSSVEEVVESQSILFEEIVIEFQLMHPISPHLLHFDIVRKYTLTDAAISSEPQEYQ